MKNYLIHIKDAFRFSKLIALVYVVQLVLGLIVGGRLFQLIDDKIGDRGTMIDFVNGWNYSAIHDFLYYYARELGEIKSLFGLLILIYIVASAFINSGVWECLKDKENNLGRFLHGIVSHWGKFLTIGLVSVILMIAITGAIWIPFGSRVTTWLEYKPDERFVVYTGGAMILLWAVCLGFIFSWSYAVKAHYIEKGLRWWAGIRQGTKWWWTNLMKILLTVILFGVVGMLILYFTMVSEAWIGNDSVTLIFVMIVIQQVVVWFKIGLRFSVIRYFLSNINK